jgi:hypothetical protein
MGCALAATNGQKGCLESLKASPRLGEGNLRTTNSILSVGIIGLGAFAAIAHVPEFRAKGRAEVIGGE